jgi:hypothetical protein
MLSLFKPKISDVLPFREGWEEHESSENSIFWFTEERDACMLQFTGRCDWPFDLRDFAAAKLFYENQCQGLDGALVDIYKDTIQGVESLVGIFKYKSPEPQSLAMYYVGIVWMPFEKCTYQINFESVERGTTGAREAAVALVKQPKPPVTEEKPIMLESADDLFNMVRNKAVEVYPSDNSEFDEMFPDHPLSKVRKNISEFKHSAKMNKKLKKLKSYRVRS